MDKELFDLMVNLKIEAKAFRVLVDTILENSRLGYCEDGLRLEDEAPIYAVIKAFAYDEYTNRMSDLRAEKIAAELGAKVVDEDEDEEA